MLQNKMDSNTALFFQSELETIESKIYETKFPARKFAEGMIIPITQLADRTSKKLTYVMTTRTGLAKMINNYALDLPAVSITGKEVTINLKHLGASFQYTMFELQAAMKLGKPLIADGAKAGLKAIVDKLNKIAVDGEEAHGIYGFKHLLDTYVSEVILTNDGTGSSKKFSTKTFTMIMRDLNSLANNVIENTEGSETPDTMLVPLTTYNLISTVFNTSTDNTVLKLFLATNPYIKEVIPVPELETMGAGGTRRIVVYEKNPDKISFEVPVPYESLPPEPKNLAWVINQYALTGGVFSRYPLSLSFADDV